MATPHRAKAFVKNNTKENMYYVTLLHKYSSRYYHTLSWDCIEPGKQTPDLDVEYNTGFGTTGHDWWLVMWFDQDLDRFYASTPDNWRWMIDKAETGISELVAYKSYKVGAEVGRAIGRRAGSAIARAAIPVLARQTVITGGKIVAGIATGGTYIAGAIAIEVGIWLTNLVINDAVTTGWLEYVLNNDDSGKSVEFAIESDNVLKVSSPGHSKPETCPWSMHGPAEDRIKLLRDFVDERSRHVQAVGDAVRTAKKLRRIGKQHPAKSIASARGVAIKKIVGDVLDRLRGRAADNYPVEIPDKYPILLDHLDPTKYTRPADHFRTVKDVQDWQDHDGSDEDDDGNDEGDEDVTEDGDTGGEYNGLEVTVLGENNELHDMLLVIVDDREDEENPGKHEAAQLAILEPSGDFEQIHEIHEPSQTGATSWSYESHSSSSYYYESRTEWSSN